MLGVYVATLDRWTSPDSLHEIANLSGLTWLAELSGPLTYLVTFPIRWLPAVRIPLAINLFTAVCAALTLAQLARCVALLPHDRTQDERQRNPNRQAFLTTRLAWLPPVLGVLVCGLQLAFWQQAVSATGEMFDLLLFAYLVRCLLEFRIGQRESWLLKFALVNGLAIANNWAMVAFFPAFLLALLWINGIFNFFNPVYVALFIKEKRFSLRLPLRLLACWLAGCSLIILLPFLAAHSQRNHVDFWPGLGFVLQQYKYHLFTRALPTRLIFYMSLTTVLPVLFMGIRWGFLVREANSSAVFVLTSLFHFIHAFFLVVCLWGALDSPFSPRRIQPVYSCLPLYFLGALSVGYFSGYFLLVFGPRNEKFRWLEHRLTPYVNMVSVGTTCALLLLAPLALAAKNLPDRLQHRSGAMTDYFNVLEKSLPPKGSAIFSEDPDRLAGLETRLIRSGRRADYLLVDATLLTRFPGYLKFLDAQNPSFKITSSFTNQPSEITNSLVIVGWMRDFCRTGGIYFLHPCAGFLTEKFYPQPQKLFVQLQPYPPTLISAAPLSRELLAENREFWRVLREEEFPALLRRIQPPPPAKQKDAWHRLLTAAHILPEPDRSALLAGCYYSVMLNSWGVDLQRIGALAEAGACFDDARKLNPDNAAAQMNWQCNQDLAAQKSLTVDPAMRVVDKLGRNRDWDQSICQDGPIDEPSACYRLGLVCTESRMYRQAFQQFGRAQVLAPASVDASLRLAELFVRIGDSTNSLAEAERALKATPQNPRALILKGLDLIQQEKFNEALAPLNTLINLQTNDIDAHLARALAYLKMKDLPAAQGDYEVVVRLRPNAFPAYYGLADIAHQRKDIPTLIKNCELYNSNVPPNAPETDQINLWLKEAKPAGSGH